MVSPIIQVTGIEKSFKVGEQTVAVLRGLDATINMGDFVVVVGPSGCGKSTFLHIILGLEKPSSGNVVFLGESIYKDTTEDYRSDFRKKHIGMVYQQPNWIKSMTVVENVAFPMLLLGMDKETAVEHARGLLGQLRMQEWADYMPSELSGGQQQRVSMARALANNPEIIIADEPTGNLDYQTGQELMLLLSELNSKHNKTIIMVTHDLEYLKYAHSAIQMFDGKIKAIFGPKEIEDFLKNTRQKRGVTESPESEPSAEESSSTQKEVTNQPPPSAPTTSASVTPSLEKTSPSSGPKVTITSI